LKETSVGTQAASERPLWFFSRRADFWLASAGASVGLLAAIFLILLHGDHELDALDFVLSEFHLGATYGAIIRRRLWRHRPLDVLLIPLIILALTYALSMSGQAILLTSITMYAAVWHRGRQSLGVARFYQRQVNGPASQAHNILFRGAIYLPMLAAMLAYTHLAPTKYEGGSYLALNLGAEITSFVLLSAALWVFAYLAWTFWQTYGDRLAVAPYALSTLLTKSSECFDKLSRNGIYSIIPNVAAFAPSSRSGPALRLTRTDRWMIQQRLHGRVHPGEWWVVLAHAVAFGSSYALGASNASFLLVLAVHHEVQYLYFTYAMARRRENFFAQTKGLTGDEFYSKISPDKGCMPRFEIKFMASFLLWPVIGFVGATIGGWLELQWLAPLGVGGLFCHYWLDGRIWTRKSFQN
jgi:hypothetical protein